jgi:hypothetical protein
MRWSDLPVPERQTRLRSLHLEIVETVLVDRRLRSLLVCRACGYVLSPQANSVNKHLKEKHQPLATRYQGLTTFLRSLPLSDPRELPLPEDHLSPFPHLTVRRGYSCSKCLYRSLSDKLVSDYLTAQHPDLRTSS